MMDVVTIGVLHFERMLDAPIDTVWRWLVEPEFRSRWFMSGDGDDLRRGGKIGLGFSHRALSDDAVPTPERYERYMGNQWCETITHFDPPFLFAISWDSGAGGSVTFALADFGSETRLSLDHVGLRGADDATNFGGGWVSHLAVLERRLRNERVADSWTLHADAEAYVKAALSALQITGKQSDAAKPFNDDCAVNRELEQGAIMKPHAYVLAVHDLAGSAKYLVDALGFTVEWQDEDRWQALVRDNVRLMLGRCPEALPPAQLGDHSYFAFITTDDLDQLYETFIENGAIIRSPPQDRPWGWREMAIATPEGHRMMFAQRIG